VGRQLDRGWQASAAVAALVAVAALASLPVLVPVAS
jgi:hypothetical protein